MTTMRKGDDRTTEQPTHNSKIDHQRGLGDGGGSRDNSNDFEDNNNAREQTVMVRSEEAAPLYHGWRWSEEAMPPCLHL